jgi:hypothetical protein
MAIPLVALAVAPDTHRRFAGKEKSGYNCVL